jgi:tetratricopeptide (TPR) repeat protein
MYHLSIHTQRISAPQPWTGTLNFDFRACSPKPLHPRAKHPTQMSAVHDPRLDCIRTLEHRYSALQSDLPLLEERIQLLHAVIADIALNVPDESGVYLVDLVKAETHLRLSLPNPSLTEALFPGPACVLGSVLREQAFHNNSVPLSTEAHTLHLQAFTTCSSLPDLERAQLCRELGLTLKVCYHIDPAAEHYLMNSIRRLNEAQALFADIGVADHACSSGLSAALVNLYGKQTRKADLTQAMSVGDLALTQCTSGHRDFYQVVWFASLSYYYSGWFCNDMVALNKDIGVLRIALVNAPLGWAALLTARLAEVLGLRFRKQGSRADLDEAITRVRTTLDGVDLGALQWGQLQYCLDDLLRIRFGISGAAEDIESAARAAELALSQHNAGSPLHTSALALFAMCRGEQHSAFGNIAHLDECVNMFEQIVQSTRSGSTDSMTASKNLIEALTARAEATRTLSDLNRAIELMPNSDTQRQMISSSANAPDSFHNMGKTYLSRFKITGSLDDLERTTELHEQAFHACQTKTSEAAYFLYHDVSNAYAQVLRIRYEVLHEKHSAAKALGIHMQALRALPIAHAARTQVLCGLARVRMCTSPSQLDAEEALDFLLDAVSNNYCPAYRRLQNTTDVLTYVSEHVSHLDHHNALKLAGVYSAAISLLPQVASFGLDPRTRLSVISGSRQLTARGASHAIAVGQHKLALEMLEAGRSVFWTQGLRLRTPFTDLPPSIGDRLIKITSDLGQPAPSSFANEAAKDDEFTRRRRLGDEFATVLAEARMLPGFEDLLQNSSFASLARAAQQHPVVVLVPGESIGHALIILENAQCVSITLEEATEVLLKTLSGRIELHSRHVRSSRGVRKVQAAAAGPTDVYRELWTLVMAPIVHALGWPVSARQHGTRNVLNLRRRRKDETGVGWSCVLQAFLCSCPFTLRASTRATIRSAAQTTSFRPTFRPSARFSTLSRPSRQCVGQRRTHSSWPSNILSKAEHSP